MRKHFKDLFSCIFCEVSVFTTDFQKGYSHRNHYYSYILSNNIIKNSESTTTCMFCMGMHSILVCAAAMWEQQKATEAILMLYIMISLFMLFPLYSGPGAPEITLESASGDSLTVSWSVPSGTVVEMYELMWIIEGPQLQPVEIRNTVSSSTHRYSVPVLNMYENVTVVMTVTSVNAVGSSSSSPLTVHSDIIQSGPTSEETINIGAIIGGAVGIFLIGAALGITTAIIITFKYRNKYDR